MSKPAAERDYAKIAHVLYVTKNIQTSGYNLRQKSDAEVLGLLHGPAKAVTPPNAAAVAQQAAQDQQAAAFHRQAHAPLPKSRSQIERDEADANARRGIHG